MDGGPKNHDLKRRLAERYGIQHVIVSAYHPQANGLVERGHSPLVASLTKLIEGGTRGS